MALLTAPTVPRQGRLSPPRRPRSTLVSSQRDWLRTRSAPDPQPAVRQIRSHLLAILHYVVVFFIIALIAAVFGFGGIAASAVGIAKILFVVFAILAVGSFLFGIAKRG